MTKAVFCIPASVVQPYIAHVLPETHNQSSVVDAMAVVVLSESQSLSLTPNISKGLKKSVVDARFVVLNA
jgi:hypothetical protein